MEQDFDYDIIQPGSNAERLMSEVLANYISEPIKLTINNEVTKNLNVGISIRKYGSINDSVLTYVMLAVDTGEKTYYICTVQSNLKRIVNYFSYLLTFDIETLKTILQNKLTISHNRHFIDYNSFYCMDIREDLGEIHRSDVGEFIIVWCSNKQAHVLIKCNPHTGDTDVYSIPLQANINGSCVVKSYDSLFAITNDGKKIYCVSRKWLEHAKSVYSEYNAQPKYFTISFNLVQDSENQYSEEIKNEGFIDFQTMVNTEILQLSDPIETMVDRKIKEALDKKRFF